MTICPRGCVEPVIVMKGKKKIITSKPVVMHPGMILDTCPKCNFQCRPYDAKINDPQPKIELPQHLILRGK